MVKKPKKDKANTNAVERMSKSMVHIDPLALDKEWLRQGDLVLDACTTQANARKAWEKTKRQLTLHEAELKGFIRATPEEYGLAKITEGGVTSTMEAIASHQIKSDEVIEAHFRYELSKGVVDALENKRDALKDLVKLEGRGYFGDMVASDEEESEAIESIKRQKARAKGVKKRGKPD